MPRHIAVSHTIHIDAPLAQCQRFFTPAGEELWVDGWQPDYLHPADGRTEPGMVFTTGNGTEHTIWTLVDFEAGPLHHARYTRVTPGSRCGVVEVSCTADAGGGTRVAVGYALTALSDAGAGALHAYEGPRFVAMIEGWRAAIHARLPALLAASIR